MNPRFVTALSLLSYRSVFRLGPLVALACGLAGGGLLHAQNNYATPYAFTTIAGASPIGAIDGTGTAARFHSPFGIAVDAAGNVYIGDIHNFTIRKISPGGVVTTFAGSPGNPGSADGTGAAARFGGCWALAVDATGNLYAADTGNSTIRRITPAGVVTTIAGSPGVAGSADGTGAAARFNAPMGIAVDASGTLYVSDLLNYTIRKISPAGVVTTLAGQAGSSAVTDGTGAAARFYAPAGIAVDATGTLFVADSDSNTVRRVTAAGVVTTIAGTFGSGGSVDGTGAAARFEHVWGLALDAAGNMYVADENNNLVRKITPAGVVTTFAGQSRVAASTDGTGTAARFARPDGIAVDASGNVYVSDPIAGNVRKITPTGTVTTLAGPTGFVGSTDGPGNVARFSSPTGLSVDTAGNLYVAEDANQTIRKITPAGVVSTLAGSPGQRGAINGTGSAARFLFPFGTAVDATGNVYVTEQGNHTIRRISPAGAVTTFAGSFGQSGNTNGPAAAARFDGPTGIAIDASGNLYVADTENQCIRMITAAGVVSTWAGSTTGASGSADGTGNAARFDSPLMVALDGSGNLYVSDVGNATVRKISPSRVVTTLAGSAGITGSADGTGSAARFKFIVGLAADGAGNVFVADTLLDNEAPGNYLIPKNISGRERHHRGRTTGETRVGRRPRSRRALLASVGHDR